MLMKLGVSEEHLMMKGLGQIKTESNEGKKGKHRITIVIFVNSTGESKALPIVIWLSKKIMVALLA